MRESLQQFGRAIRRGTVVAALGLLFLAPVAAHADTYGSGTYNGGNYGSSASSSGASSAASGSSTNESTVVQTPSGLDVAINLSDGQAIPSTGYYITITPLNGSGQTFDKAEIYLDGQLAYSGAPDSTGTLKWLWDTSKNPATKVKIIVYGPGSGTTTHEFSVTVSPVESSSSQTPVASEPASNQATSSGWPIWLFWGSIGGATLLVLLIAIWLVMRRRRGGQQLPPPTVFPPA